MKYLLVLAEALLLSGLIAPVVANPPPSCTLPQQLVDGHNCCAGFSFKGDSYSCGAPQPDPVPGADPAPTCSYTTDQLVGLPVGVPTPVNAICTNTIQKLFFPAVTSQFRCGSDTSGDVGLSVTIDVEGDNIVVKFDSSTPHDLTFQFSATVPSNPGNTFTNSICTTSGGIETCQFTYSTNLAALLTSLGITPPDCGTPGSTATLYLLAHYTRADLASCRLGPNGEWPKTVNQKLTVGCKTFCTSYCCCPPPPPPPQCTGTEFEEKCTPSSCPEACGEDRDRCSTGLDNNPFTCICCCDKPPAPTCPVGKSKCSNPLGCSGLNPGDTGSNGCTYTCAQDFCPANPVFLTDTCTCCCPTPQAPDCVGPACVKTSAGTCTDTTGCAQNCATDACTGLPSTACTCCCTPRAGTCTTGSSCSDQTKCAGDSPPCTSGTPGLTCHGEPDPICCCASPGTPSCPTGQNDCTPPHAKRRNMRNMRRRDLYGVEPGVAKLLGRNVLCPAGGSHPTCPTDLCSGQPVSGCDDICCCSPLKACGVGTAYAKTASALPLDPICTHWGWYFKDVSTGFTANLVLGKAGTKVGEVVVTIVGTTVSWSYNPSPGYGIIEAHADILCNNALPAHKTPPQSMDPCVPGKFTKNSGCLTPVVNGKSWTGSYTCSSNPYALIFHAKIAQFVAQDFLPCETAICPDTRD